MAIAATPGFPVRHEPASNAEVGQLMFSGHLAALRLLAHLRTLGAELGRR
jgi:hypothetical protein